MPDMTRREFLGWAASALAAPAFLASCARKPRSKSVNFLNWAGYIGKDTLAKFERETGLQVNYDIYSSEEGMFAKLKASAEGYDLVVAPDHMIPKLKASALIAPMPRDLRPLDSVTHPFRDPAYDPGLAFSVPYLWGTTGLGFHKDHFPKPPSSWRALWDQRLRGRISMLDNAREAIQCALLFLRLPTDSKDPGQLQKARELLISQRALIKGYDSSSYPEELAAGELWLAHAWSGDILQVAQENSSVDFVVPEEGSFLWVDNLCLARAGAQKEEVLRLVEYLLRPDVAAGISNAVRYATPNEKALALLEPALRRDPRVFPPEEVRSRLRFSAPLDPAADALWSRTWEEIKGA